MSLLIPSWHNAYRLVGRAGEMGDISLFFEIVTLFLFSITVDCQLGLLVLCIVANRPCISYKKLLH